MQHSCLQCVLQYTGSGVLLLVFRSETQHADNLLHHLLLLLSPHSLTHSLTPHAYHREYAATLSSHVGMLTMSQLGAAERRRDWNKEVAHVRATCQVRACVLRCAAGPLLAVCCDTLM